MEVILAVDLAAAKSGVSLLHDGQLVNQWVTKNMRPLEFVQKLAAQIGPETHFILEDMFSKHPNSIVLRDTFRMQGRMMLVSDMRKPLDETWIQPATWQHYFKVFGGGKWAIQDKAKELGWTPPEGRMDVKSISDMADAFMIGQWAWEMLKLHRTLDVKGPTGFRQFG